MSTFYTHQRENKIKTWLLMSIFLGVVIAIGWFLSYRFNSALILYLAVFISIIMNIWAYWFSDKTVLKMTKAKEADHNEFLELHRIVENLSITAGLPKPKVYVINDNAPNAFATGRNKEHSVVAVTTGLLNILDKNELEGVIAHELSHIGNSDMLISTVAVILVGMISIISDILLRSSLFGGDDRRSNGLILLISLIAAILMPIVAALLRFAISRKREFLADATAVMLTRYPEGLASALRKITSNGLKMKSANSATAHLFISNPFGRRMRVNKLFSTHPDPELRIKLLMEMDGNI